MAWVEIGLWAVEGYVVLGLLFGLFFVTRGVAKVDDASQNSGWGFRVMMFPGSVALWPLLLGKVLRVRAAERVEL